MSAKKITLKDGAVRYRIVTDAGRDPETGKRRQLTQTFDRKKDADAELARIHHERATGTFVAPSRLTVDAWVDEYLKAALFEARASTAASYRAAFRPVRERLGHRTLQSLCVADVEDLKQWMLTAGRRRGGPAGTALGPRSVRLTLSLLSSALEKAVDEGRVVRNVARRGLVKPPRYVKPERETWTGAEVRTFLAAAADDRLHAAWRLSLYGLRRGEVLGLRWADVDLKARTLTVRQARVLVDYKVRIEEPKSRNGFRTLPLDDALVAALTALRKRQAAESAAAGPAYSEGAYVVCDEAGEPVHPEWYSDEFGRLLKHGGLRRITLHDGRHTTLTLMEHAGVPISIISKWAGHYDSGFTQRTYLHAAGPDLLRGTAALAEIHDISEAM